MNYGNLAWASTHKTKLESLYRKQKHAIRIINFKNHFDHAKPLLHEMKILSLYELNILNTLLFMFKCKLKICPRIFYSLYTLKPQNKYTTRSYGHLFEPLCKTKFEQFRITYRAPHLWNKLLASKREITDLDNLPLYKEKVKGPSFRNRKC